MDNRTIKLIREAKQLLDSLNNRKVSEVTPEQRELMNEYSDLMKVQMALNIYHDGDLIPESKRELLEKYTDVNLSNIEEQLVLVGEKLNKSVEGIEEN